MNPRGREHQTARLHALIEDLLDDVAGEEPGGFDLGIITVGVEVLPPNELDDLTDPNRSNRAEVGYEPRSDSYLAFRCSDTRRRVQEAIFRDLADDLRAGVDTYRREKWRRHFEGRNVDQGEGERDLGGGLLSGRWPRWKRS
jgi:hypothetical protein